MQVHVVLIETVQEVIEVTEVIGAAEVIGEAEVIEVVDVIGVVEVIEVPEVIEVIEVPEDSIQVKDKSQGRYGTTNLKQIGVMKISNQRFNQLN